MGEACPKPTENPLPLFQTLILILDLPLTTLLDNLLTYVPNILCNKLSYVTVHTQQPACELYNDFQ